MDSLLQDVRFAIRTLAKAPLFTTLCILCLAVGIGLNANIYSAVYAAFLRVFPYAAPGGIVVGAFGITRVIQSLLIDVSSTDAASFVGVTAFLAAVALFASYVPARRATRVDPLTALRAE